MTGFWTFFDGIYICSWCTQTLRSLSKWELFRIHKSACSLLSWPALKMMICLAIRHYHRTDTLLASLSMAAYLIPHHRSLSLLLLLALILRLMNGDGKVVCRWLVIECLCVTSHAGNRWCVLDTGTLYQLVFCICLASNLLSIVASLLVSLSPHQLWLLLWRDVLWCLKRTSSCFCFFEKMFLFLVTADRYVNLKISS